MPLSKSILVSLILDKDAVSKWSNLFDRMHVNLRTYMHTIMIQLI